MLFPADVVQHRRGRRFRRSAYTSEDDFHHPDGPSRVVRADLVAEILCNRGDRRATEAVPCELLRLLRAELSPPCLAESAVEPVILLCASRIVRIPDNRMVGTQRVRMEPAKPPEHEP